MRNIKSLGYVGRDVGQAGSDSSIHCWTTFGNAVGLVRWLPEDCTRWFRPSRPRNLSRHRPCGGGSEAALHQSLITNHFSFLISHFSLPSRSAHLTRNAASSVFDKKDSRKPSDVQNPKPSPNARPLITQASVRFFLTC